MPLAKEFAKIFKVIAYDTNLEKIKQFEKLKHKNLFFSNNPLVIKDANIFIVCVPTPIKKDKTPDLKSLKIATKTISKSLKRGDLVIFESTVYPGLTEEVCIPILKKKNNLKLNKDFYVGYSPERISPGEKSDLTKINKVISGSDIKTTNLIYKLYKK